MGVVQVGSGLSVNNGILSAQIANPSFPGVVMVSVESGLVISAGGVLSLDATVVRTNVANTFTNVQAYEPLVSSGITTGTLPNTRNVFDVTFGSTANPNISTQAALPNGSVQVVRLTWQIATNTIGVPPNWTISGYTAPAGVAGSAIIDGIWLAGQYYGKWNAIN